MLSVGLVLFNVIFLIGACATMYHAMRKKPKQEVTGVEGRAYDIVSKMVKNADSECSLNESWEVELEQMERARALVKEYESRTVDKVSDNIYRLDTKRKEKVA